MKTILNFIPVVSGGSLQNSLSFLDMLSCEDDLKHNCVAIVRRGSETQRLCCKRNIEHVSFSSNNVARLAFELSCPRQFTKGQTCFSIFGPPMLRSVGYLLNVNGCAYSNLFYPEMKFWIGRSRAYLLRKECIDMYRKYLMAKADYWIFETTALRNRAIELCGFPASRVGVVRMAVSSLVSPKKVEESVVDQFGTIISKRFRFLFLSSAHPNKRLWILPEIAKELEKRGCVDFIFVTTMPKEHKHTIEVTAKFREFGMEKHLCNVGLTPPSRVSSLIHCIDAMCTFSRLESFSNNFIEAWRMQKPLVATDADWTRDSCGEAALYVDPENIRETAKALDNFMSSNDLRKAIVENGNKQLAEYPTAAEKMRLYFSIMKEAESLGPCEPHDRRQIHWPKCGTGWS